MSKPFCLLSPLALYQQLAQLSEQILDAIQQKQWSTAAKLCDTYTDTLKALEHLPGLTREQLQERRPFLGAILTNDALIHASLNSDAHIYQPIYDAHNFEKHTVMHAYLH